MTRRPAAAWLALVSLAVACVLGLVVLSHLSGCAASPVTRQAVAISLVADVTSGGALAIDAAARADLHATCPTLAPECVTAVRARWAPADAAIGGVVVALNAWRDAVDIARQAGATPGTTVLRAVQALARAYESMRTVLAGLHVAVPALPAEAAAAIAAVVGGGV